MVELWKSEGRDYTTQHPNQVQIICCTHKKNITVLPLDYCCRDPKGMVNKEKHYYYLWNAMESAKRCFGRYVLPHSPDNLWWQALSVPLHKHRPCQFPATASFCCLRECAVQWSEYPLLNTKSWNLLASYLSMWVHMLLQNILWSCTFHEKIRPSLVFFFFSFTCHYLLPVTVLSRRAGHHAEKKMISFGNPEQNCTCDAPTLVHFLPQNFTICPEIAFFFFLTSKGHSTK